MGTLERGGRAAAPAEMPESRDPASRLLRWRLILAAVVAVSTLIAGLIGIEHVSRPGVLGALGLLATSLAVSWAAVMAGAPQRPLLVAQLAADTMSLGLLVHFTGGPYSAIPLAFCVPIMLGATFLDRRWALIFAGTAAVLVGGGHFGLALGWLFTGTHSDLDYLTGWPVMVTALHMSLFVVVGMISGGLAQRLDARRREQVCSQEQIEAARCEVRDILDNIGSGLLTVDAMGVVTRANPACCRILAIPAKDLLGRELDLPHGGGLSELAGMIGQVAAGGTPIRRGEVRLWQNGAAVPVGLNVNHVTGAGGEIRGAVAVFTDLTREKELTERVRESDRLAAIGELAASIAHEIRNPLASIRGSVEMLAGELELVGYQRQLFELVLKESARVNSIINDFLAYSRMRPVSWQRFSAAGFRDEMLLLVRQNVSAANGDVRVSAEVVPDELELSADPGQLTQLTLNLAINACEAMRYRGRLRMALHLVEGGETCELTVTDDGPGIEAEIRDSLFQPFKTTKDKGTGLGLSVVARIAAAHGGNVRAEDAPGGGAIFRVRWPLRQAHDAGMENPSPLVIPAPADDAFQVLLSV